MKSSKKDSVNLDVPRDEAPGITLVKDDAERLWALLEHGVGRRDREVVDQLEGELVRARIVAPEALPPNVVRVGSRVRYESASDGAARDVVLVWPHEADMPTGRISVLSPIGSALIGLQPGQEIAWSLPGGRATRVRVVAVEAPAPASAPPAGVARGEA